MKKILFALFVTCSFIAKAQVYNNEWIDYTKTYYKFKVGKTGLYRIPKTLLDSAGIGSASAEDFQLWRNGVQIPIYTSVATGALGTGSYIEFWGEMNDGKPDKALYRNPDYQLNDKWSLETDTAAYFLTTNSGGTNLRLTVTANNVAGNTLPVEPYFMYTVGNYFKNKINPGYAVNVGEYVYSSSYDRGEGYTSADIGTGVTNTATFSNLFTYTSGPNATFRIAVSGNAVNPRNYKVVINNDSIVGGPVDYFGYVRDSATVSLSTLATNSAAIKVINQCQQPNDRMVIHKYELTYPRQFNFGNATNFEFYLPANAAGNYLEIRGFTYGTTTPVLYDITNGKRYAVNTSTASVLKVVLEPSLTDRRLILVSEQPTNINTVTALQSRNFINYDSPDNQGDYIIISNTLLNGNGGTSAIEDYRSYRSSAEGGNYNAKTYWVDDLVDQFGFGIKKNPLAIRNFLLFARNRFAVTPKQVFIMGKGVNYTAQRANESNANINSLNLVPTFGYPASDVLLSANPGSSIPEIPIGRLSVISADEIAAYLKKVKDYEKAQQTSSPQIQDKLWMKNVVHAVGASDPGLQAVLNGYMANYKKIISDTLFGGNVTTFSKTSADAVQEAKSAQLSDLFAEGISLLTYFGHSASTVLEFNLETPDKYNNPGKYPMFVALGCQVGDIFTFDTKRYTSIPTISENFVLEKDKGSIGFIASSYLGIVSYLDTYASRFYKTLSVDNYGKPISTVMQTALRNMYGYTTQEDFYARCTGEELVLNGDPAIVVNSFPKPDYAIEEPQVKISPDFVSIADQDFKVNAKIYNIGKAINHDVVIEIKRVLPDQSVKVYRDTLPGIRCSDSISFNLPIDPLHDKGLNKVTFTIDPDNVIDELFETNNSISKDVFIYEDEARPAYPYNYSIVNRQDIKLKASTANAFSATKQYSMEIDTTELFNSPLKVSRSVTTGGGVMEFEPGISFKDSTVYYWHVGIVPDTGKIRWSEASSFIYLSGQSFGMNQSHKFQHLKSSYTKLYLDTAINRFYYPLYTNNLFIKNAVYPTASGQDADFHIFINGVDEIAGGCNYNEVIFNVLDPLTLTPWKNDFSGTTGLYNSLKATCGTKREYNFEYLLNSSQSRKNAMDFLDQIPAGAYVIVRTNANSNFNSNTYSNVWQSDTALFGSNNSLYHKLLQQGITSLDSFNRPRAFTFVFKKGQLTEFPPQMQFSQGVYDKMDLNLTVNTPGNTGEMQSPVFGPAKAWKEFKWDGYSLDNGNGDNAKVNIVGVKSNGAKDVLFSDITPDQRSVDISSINAAQYPYLQLSMENQDTVYHTPYQLRYWRLIYNPVPEGALAPNLYLSMKDSLALGENIDFKVAFKNISDVPFDSLKVKVVVTDKNNVSTIIQERRYKPLQPNDTLHVVQPINTEKFKGLNNLFIEVNPDNDQPEQYHFNNFGYKSFYVLGDTLNPLLDVTFDNTHILNHDIVSAKPAILIKLKDESKWLLLDDTSLVTIQVRYPNGSLRKFNFNSDTLQFIPATKGTNDNTATVNFKPYFTEDGDYELIITGKDKGDNQAGQIQYRVAFSIINKAMISNMLNYPNPFTTSTAFVFTITGSEVPQNIRIQILTVTGKIVREINKEELGSLHIGRNITEFKWDGTDQYGQKVANGVYLYRVITNLNGKALEKYKSDSDNTDKYFNKGYGKMYLMR